VPEIGDGNGVTFTEPILAQPVANVYVIGAVPGDTPNTTPVDEPIVATPVAPLVHVPPPGEENKVVLCPVHILERPVIADGSGSTVTVTLTKHPPGAV